MNRCVSALFPVPPAPSTQTLHCFGSATFKFSLFFIFLKLQ